MKILIATPLYPPETGGPATYVKLLEEGLPRLGIDVVVLKFSDVRHLPTGFRHAAYFFRCFKAARGVDLIYALDAMSVGLPAYLAALLSPKPFMVKIVGDFAWEQGMQRYGLTATLDEFVRQRRVSFAQRFYRLIQTAVARGAACVVVPSHYLEQVIAEWGVDRQKMKVVWNAIQKEAPGTVPPEVAALPRPLIVSVGRLVPWKGFAELITAAQMLRGRRTPASLAIIGEGPEREALARQARNQLKDGYVFTGALSHKETLAAMAHADVFVLYSRYEGLSHVLIEALQSGAAIVASDIGGNREVIERDKNGLLVSPSDDRGLADALQRLLADPALRQRLAAAARESSASFSADAMLEKTAECLRGIL